MPPDADTAADTDADTAAVPHLDVTLLEEARPASGALTKTGGFLCGFTHTLQPYIGCRFGCAYCYVKGLQVHRFHQPFLPWGDYVHPRTGIDTHLRSELARAQDRGALGALAIFMSSATDPYQPAERTWRLARACLDVLIDFPPRDAAGADPLAPRARGL